MEINIFGSDQIIQIWIISSKVINIQYLWKIYCRELGQYLMQFDALEKKCGTTNYSIWPYWDAGEGEGQKGPSPYQFFSYNFYKCRN